jgi:flagellar assembly factor FliW
LPYLDTAKFGNVQYSESDVLTFVRAILGFEDLRQFIIISRPESEPFKWLQSLEDPNVAFVIVEPRLILDNYVVELSQHDIKQLHGTQQLSDYKIFVIMTVPKGHPEKISVNLQGPLIVNLKNLKAIQMVLNNPEYDIRFSLFENQSTVTS